MAALKRSSSLQTPNTSELEESGRSSPVRSHKLSDAPRTPTPFKRALADVYQRGDPLSNTVSVHLEDDHALSCFMSSLLQPQTPTKLVEDITEIIKKEQIHDLSYTSPSDFSVRFPYSIIFDRDNFRGP